MDVHNYIFTAVVFICFLLSIATFIHFVYSINRAKLTKILRVFSFLSLSGYNAHIFISLLLYIYDSIFIALHESADNTDGDADTPRILPYNRVICNVHTLNIIPFFIGKMCMYYFFLSLIHVSFRGSFIAYRSKLLLSIAAVFTSIMLIIFAFYAYSTFIDISSMGAIQSPQQCASHTISTLSTIIIYAGSCFDALWSILCLALFYYKLRQLIVAMRELTASEMISSSRSGPRRRSQSAADRRRTSYHCSNPSPVEIITHASNLATTSKSNQPQSQSQPDTTRKTLTFTNTNTVNSGTNASMTPRTTATACSITPQEDPALHSPQSSVYLTDAISESAVDLDAKSSGKVSFAPRVTLSVVSETAKAGNVVFSVQPVILEAAIEEEEEEEDGNISIIYDDETDENDADVDPDPDDEKQTQHVIMTERNLDAPKLQTIRPSTNPLASASASDLRRVSAGQHAVKSGTGHHRFSVPMTRYPMNKMNKTVSDSASELHIHSRHEDELRMQRLARSQSASTIRYRSRSLSNVHTKQLMVEQFLPVVLKLSLLSFWCAFSTVLLAFGFWAAYPALSSSLDSTINALCVYLTFAFSQPMYKILCAPLYSCCKCTEIENIINKFDQEVEREQLQNT